MAVTKFSNLTVTSGRTYNTFLAGNPAYTPPSFESIATATGTGSSGTITFNSIPSTFKHLQLRCLAQDSGTGTTGSIFLQFNSDTGANYAYHYLQGDGTSPTATGVNGASNIYIGRPTRGGSYPDIMGVFIIDILDYSSTTKNKTLKSLSGVDINTTGSYIIQHSGAWFSTSAISTISLSIAANNATTKSTFALYGIKEF